MTLHFPESKMMNPRTNDTQDMLCMIASFWTIYWCLSGWGVGRHRFGDTRCLNFLSDPECSDSMLSTVKVLSGDGPMNRTLRAPYVM